MGLSWAGVGGEKRWWDDGISRYNAPTEGDFLLQPADSELRPLPDPSLHYTQFKGEITCYRCGGPHLATKRKHQDVICSKKGHFAIMCKSKVRDEAAPSKEHFKDTQTSKPTNYMDEEQRSTESEDELLNILSGDHTDPYMVEVTLNGVPISMELDTGAAVSVINQSTYRSI